MSEGFYPADAEREPSARELRELWKKEARNRRRDMERERARQAALSGREKARQALEEARRGVW